MPQAIAAIAPSGPAIGRLQFVSADWRTWHFQSSEDPAVFWTVDLAAWDRSGACTCPHFDFRIRTRLATGAIRPHTPRARCKHIERADRILCFRVKEELFVAV
jgi:hypothetical protein